MHYVKGFTVFLSIQSPDQLPGPSSELYVFYHYRLNFSLLESHINYPAYCISKCMPGQDIFREVGVVNLSIDNDYVVLVIV